MVYLTKKQKVVFDYLQEYITEKGYAPSIREMCKHFGKSSVNTMHKYLITLEAKGLIKRDAYRRRAVELVEREHKKVEAFDVPVMGNISDNAPIETLDKIEFVSVPGLYQNAMNTYFLKVNSNNLTGEYLLNGDYLLVDSRKKIENGEIAIIKTDKENVIVRKVFKEENHFLIHEISPFKSQNYIKEKELDITGVVIGVFRNLFSKKYLEGDRPETPSKTPPYLYLDELNIKPFDKNKK